MPRPRLRLFIEQQQKPELQQPILRALANVYERGGRRSLHEFAGKDPRPISNLREVEQLFRDEVASWCAKNGMEEYAQVRAFSVRQAVALLRGRLQPLLESDPEISIKRSELKLTCSFVAEVTATFKAVRHFLRANPAVRAQGCPYPEYTPQFERMITFIQSMPGRLGNSR